MILPAWSILVAAIFFYLTSPDSNATAHMLQDSNHDAPDDDAIPGSFPTDDPPEVSRTPSPSTSSPSPSPVSSSPTPSRLTPTFRVELPQQPAQQPAPFVQTATPALELADPLGATSSSSDNGSQDLNGSDFLADDMYFDDEGLGTLEKIYLFARSRAVFHRVFISRSLPNFLPDVNPHEAVEYVLPLLNSLGTDPEESVREAFVSELVPTVWWFYSNCQLVDEGYFALGTNAPSTGHDTTATSSAEHHLGRPTNNESNQTTEPHTSLDSGPLHSSSALIEGTTHADHQPEAPVTLPLLPVQVFTPLMASLLLSANAVVGDAARAAVVELLRRLKDGYDADAPDSPFGPAERKMLETEILMGIVIGMARMDLDVPAEDVSRRTDDDPLLVAQIGTLEPEQSTDLATETTYAPTQPEAVEVVPSDISAESSHPTIAVAPVIEEPSAQFPGHVPIPSSSPSPPSHLPIALGPVPEVILPPLEPPLSPRSPQLRFLTTTRLSPSPVPSPTLRSAPHTPPSPTLRPVRLPSSESSKSVEIPRTPFERDEHVELLGLQGTGNAGGYFPGVPLARGESVFDVPQVRELPPSPLELPNAGSTSRPSISPLQSEGLSPEQRRTPSFSSESGSTPTEDSSNDTATPGERVPVELEQETDPVDQSPLSLVQIPPAVPASTITSPTSTSGSSTTVSGSGTSVPSFGSSTDTPSSSAESDVVHTPESDEEPPAPAVSEVHMGEHLLGDDRDVFRDPSQRNSYFDDNQRHDVPPRKGGDSGSGTGSGGSGETVTPDPSMVGVGFPVMHDRGRSVRQPSGREGAPRDEGGSRPSPPGEADARAVFEDSPLLPQSTTQPPTSESETSRAQTPPPQSISPSHSPSSSPSRVRFTESLNLPPPHPQADSPYPSPPTHMPPAAPLDLASLVIPSTEPPPPTPDDLLPEDPAHDMPTNGQSIASEISWLQDVPQEDAEANGDGSEEAAVGRVASMSLVAAVTAAGVLDEETKVIFTDEVVRVGRDTIYWVRREAAYALGALAKVVPLDVLTTSLLPLYEDMTDDEVWHVRQSALFALPGILAQLPADRRRELALSQCRSLAHDDAKMVRSALLEVMGEVIYCFRDDEGGPPSELVDLFMGNNEHNEDAYVAPTPEPEQQWGLRSTPNRDTSSSRSASPPPPSPWETRYDPTAAEFQDLFGHPVPIPGIPPQRDPNRVLICAFNFPAVVAAMGSKRWPELRQPYRHLVQDTSSKVRRTLAASIGEIANIIGPEHVHADLTSVWWDFMHDDSPDVRTKCIGCVDRFVEALGVEDRRGMGAQLEELWESNMASWRDREVLAAQLGTVAPMLAEAGRGEAIRNLMKNGLTDRVSAVRDASIASYPAYISGLRSQPDVLKSAEQDIQSLATSDTFRKRTTFIRAYETALFSENYPCTDVLQDADFQQTLIQLSQDAIVDVRIGLARLISAVCEKWYPEASGRPHWIQNVLRRLSRDTSVEVKSFVGPWARRPSSLTSLGSISLSPSLTAGPKDSPFAVFSRPPPSSSILDESLDDLYNVDLLEEASVPLPPSPSDNYDHRPQTSMSASAQTASPVALVANLPPFAPPSDSPRIPPISIPTPFTHDSVPKA